MPPVKEKWTSPAVFRMTMQVFSWFFLLFSALYLALFSVLTLVFLNVPGDKSPKNERVFGIAIPGKLRVILEMITAILGIMAALFVAGGAGGMLQLFIVVAYILTDRPRIQWLWGSIDVPPEYVLNYYGKTNEKEVSKKKRKNR